MGERRRLVQRAEDWPWSSVHAYRNPDESDGVTDIDAVKSVLKPVAALMAAGEENTRFDALRKSETIGRPVGDDDFLSRAEKIFGRPLSPARRGPKPRLSALSP